MNKVSILLLFLITACHSTVHHNVSRILMPEELLLIRLHFITIWGCAMLRMGFMLHIQERK